MTGPEHYAAAERLLEWVALSPAEDVQDNAPVALAAAQVHATLALAAAVAVAHAVINGRDQHGAWHEAMHVKEDLMVPAEVGEP